ncbi:hypothetical protein HK098_001504 [Nowakowskiella sp. JEL0407]|nr:hypothetical protein HK098_001504 [Nowakowskiella sp. JEL0407]
MQHPFSINTAKPPTPSPFNNNSSQKPNPVPPKNQSIFEVARNLSPTKRKWLGLGMFVFASAGIAFTNYFETKYPPLHKRSPEELERLGYDPAISRYYQEQAAKQRGENFVESAAPKSKIDLMFQSDSELKDLLKNSKVDLESLDDEVLAGGAVVKSEEVKKNVEGNARNWRGWLLGKPKSE